ncbi:MAG: PP2C family protein-serine/threonine phosphatase [Alphaproteobacteria bacterium]
MPAEPGRGGIALRLFVYTFPVVALVIAATLIALGWIGWQDRLETRQTRAQTAAHLTAHAVALPLWNLDIPVIRNQIAALGVDELVIHATVVDDKGATIATYGEPPETDREDMVFASALIQDLSDRSRSTGRVEIVLSTADVIANLRRQVKIGLGAFLVLAVGVSVAVHFAARRLVARPLETLLAAMGEVERKRWTTVDWPTADEFGAAAQAFNRMVAGLQSGDEARRLLAELERANKRVLEGIAYASNIQRGLLPARDAVGGVVAEVEWLWQPVQDVGGDWLWAETIGGKALFVVADCTGHGVPGALMTILSAAALEQAVHAEGLREPAAILARLDTLVRSRLGQDRVGSATDDGLDCAIAVWDPAKATLTYAGAGIPLITEIGGLPSVIRGDRASLGYRTARPRGAFSTHSVKLSAGDTFWLATDGVVDQMGGQSRRLYGRTRLVQAIADNRGSTLATRLAGVQDVLARWRGDEPRRDDVALLVVRPL